MAEEYSKGVRQILRGVDSVKAEDVPLDAKDAKWFDALRERWAAAEGHIGVPEPLTISMSQIPAIADAVLAQNTVSQKDVASSVASQLVSALETHAQHMRAKMVSGSVVVQGTGNLAEQRYERARANFETHFQKAGEQAKTFRDAVEHELEKQLEQKPDVKAFWHTLATNDNAVGKYLGFDLAAAMHMAAPPPKAPIAEASIAAAEPIASAAVAAERIPPAEPVIITAIPPVTELPPIHIGRDTPIHPEEVRVMNKKTIEVPLEEFVTPAGAVQKVTEAIAGHGQHVMAASTGASKKLVSGTREIVEKQYQTAARQFELGMQRAEDSKNFKQEFVAKLQKSFEVNPEVKKAWQSLGPQGWELANQHLGQNGAELLTAVHTAGGTAQTLQKATAVVETAAAKMTGKEKLAVGVFGAAVVVLGAMFMANRGKSREQEALIAQMRNQGLAQAR